jgi:branched-chain amino acid transport system substrate-binding protein
MRRAVLLLATLVVGLSQAAAAGKIGLVAPLSGPSALLGSQMQAGAQLAAADLGVELEARDDGCTAEGGAKAAQDLVSAGVGLVVGFLCGESIEAALPILKDAGIPVVTPGVRTNSLTDRRKKTGWLVYRLGPRADDERAAAASILTRLWRDDLFAIIDDGTIYGRELAESLREAAEQSGLKPAFVDTFRPQLDNQIGLLGRLRKSGATRVFAGGDREDIAIMTRDSAQLNADILFAGGEALRAAGDVPLSAGTLMIGLPEWSDEVSPDLIKRFEEKKVAPEGYVLPAYAAVEVAAAALADSATENTPANDLLADRDFSTVIGTVRFDAEGNLAQNPYRLFRYDGAHFQSVKEP